MQRSTKKDCRQVVVKALHLAAFLGSPVHFLMKADVTEARNAKRVHPAMAQEAMKIRSLEGNTWAALLS